MTKRRIILLSVAGVLTAILIIQILLGLSSPQKNFKIKETPDFVSIKNSEGMIVAQKNGDEWNCGDKKANATKINYLVEKFSNVKTLSVAARSPSQDSLDRYGLDNPIVVQAREGDKNLRTLFIGKESVSGSQCYVQIEGKSEIYLAQGNLRRDFTFNPDDLLEKESEEKNEDQEIEVME